MLLIYPLLSLSSRNSPVYLKKAPGKVPGERKQGASCKAAYFPFFPCGFVEVSRHWYRSSNKQERSLDIHCGFLFLVVTEN